MLYFTIQAIDLLSAISNTQSDKPVIGVCLQGDTTLRLRTTATLYHAGKLSRIIASGGFEDFINEPERDEFPAELMKAELVSMGVPEDKIDLEPKSKVTKDQAEFVTSLAEERGYTQLIIVTSGYHLLRAYLTFLRQVMNRGYPYTLYGYSAGSAISWLERTGTENNSYRLASFLKDELPKIRKYQSWGHVATFQEGWQYIKRLKNL